MRANVLDQDQLRDLVLRRCQEDCPEPAFQTFSSPTLHVALRTFDKLFDSPTKNDRSEQFPKSNSKPGETQKSEAPQPQLFLEWVLDFATLEPILQVLTEKEMAPGYRASGRDRNRNRTYVDHDVFEGLPVRNWRRDTVTIAPPPTYEASSKPQDKWDVELPWGMPRDSHLLPQHSQDLLRVARSGKLYLKRSAAEEEEVDVEVVVGEKPEKKEDDSKEPIGFVVKTWKALPKHQEPPEIEYLAKRRKGLIGTAIKNGVIPGPAMTQTKVRRTDSAGNTYVEELIIAEGQAIEGEVLSQTVIPSAAAVGLPGALPNTPQRKRAMPPKPKRRTKGSGRGKRRRAAQAPISVPGEPGAVKVEGEAVAPSNQEVETRTDGVKVTTETPTANDDTEMVDDSIIHSDDDGEDGEEGSSEDEDDPETKGDGEAGDDQDDEIDHHHSDVPSDDVTPPTSAHELQGNAIFPPESSRPQISHEYSGSPLKKVVTPPSNYDSTSLNQTGEEEAEGDLDDHVDDNDMDDDVEDDDQDYPIENNEMQNPYHEMGGQMGSPDPGMIHDSEEGYAMNMPHTHDPSGSFDGDEEMLLDGDMEGVDFSTMAAVSRVPEESQDLGDQPLESIHTGQSPDSIPTLLPLNSIPTALPLNSIPTALPLDSIPTTLPLDSIPTAQPPILESAFEKMEGVIHHAEIVNQNEPEADGDDGFVDLLGSLEDHLNDQGPDAPAAEATIEALEEVAKAEDPDAALEKAAAIARSSEVAEAEKAGIVEEPLTAEPVTAESVVEEKTVVEDIEEKQGQKAAAVSEKLEIPREAKVETASAEIPQKESAPEIEKALVEEIAPKEQASAREETAATHETSAIDEKVALEEPAASEEPSAREESAAIEKPTGENEPAAINEAAGEKETAPKVETDKGKVEAELEEVSTV